MKQHLYELTQILEFGSDAPNEYADNALEAVLKALEPFGVVSVYHKPICPDCGQSLLLKDYCKDCDPLGGYVPETPEEIEANRRGSGALLEVLRTAPTAKHDDFNVYDIYYYDEMGNRL